MSTASQKPFTLRWGIFSCGKIAKVFCNDLLLSPAPSPDIKHIISAVGTRNSPSRAQDFASSLTAEHADIPKIKAYGSYDELLSDPDVDIVYVASPHSHHFAHVQLCLDKGKHVLCEKAFTINAKQAKVLYNIAKEKKLFLMEAMWTRFLPITQAVVKELESGKLGAIRRVFADMGADAEEEELGEEHRLVDMNLGGGILLDVGIYPLTWPLTLLPGRSIPEISAKATLLPSGADKVISMILVFRRNDKSQQDVHCVVTTSLNGPEPTGPAIRVECEKGDVQIFGPAWSPMSFKIIPRFGDSFTNNYQEVEGGRGMYHEADACARSIRAGETECPGFLPAESLKMMEIMDEARRQCGIVYPAALESSQPASK